MKKTLLSMIFVAASVIVANAQVEQTSARARIKVNTTLPAQPVNQVSPNDMVLAKDQMIIVKEGKTMLQKNSGEIVPLQGRIVTGNGDLITQEGMIMRSNGRNERLKEGQVVSFDGNIKDAQK